MEGGFIVIIVMYDGPLMTEVPKKKSRAMRIAISILLVAAVIGFVVMGKGISFKEVGIALTKFRALPVSIAYALICSQVLSVIVRVWVLYPTGTRIGWWRISYAMSVGQLMNTFVPARAGDVLKAVVLGRETPTERAVPPMISAGVIVGDKLVDTAAFILVIIVSGAYRVPGFEFPKTVPTWAIWVAPFLLVGFVLAWKLALQQQVVRLVKWVREFRHGLSGIIQPKRLGLGLLFGVTSWVAESLALKVLSNALGIPITFEQAVFVLAILNLAIAVPVSPGNVGPFEASIALALSRFGAGYGEGVAIATVHHALQLGAIASWSAITTLVYRVIKKNPKVPYSPSHT